MSIIKPFRALRPVPEKADDVSCVPYDVIYESEVREIVAENPLSFLRVTRPEADFPEDAAPSESEILERAKANLRRLIDDEILAYEAEPSLYVYRLATGAHTQTGIVACCSIDEYEQGAIKRHEKTRPDKVEDRTDHMLALGAQTGLIFLAFRGTARIRELTEAVVKTAPLYDTSCIDGVRHTVWRIALPEAMTEAFREVPAIYIADGHHRAESARLAREKLRAANPEHTGAEEYNFVIAGLFPAEDLRILPYNRAVKDLNGLTEEEFLARVGENFVVGETDEKEPRNHGEICLYMSGRWRRLKFAVDFVRAPDPIEALDVSILQNYVLQPILGIDDPRTNERIAFVGGARGTAELEKMVDAGEARIAFSMFATTMNDLFAVSDMNEIMPPKSTWFEPKLRDGLLIHEI